jgi:hypothetical protein
MNASGTIRAAMQRALIQLVSLAALGFPTNLKAQTVTYNYAQQVNFTEFKTYQWVNIGGVTATDPVLDRDIRAAIDAQLQNRAIMKRADGAQLLVAYQVSTDREKEIAWYEGDWYYGPGWTFDMDYDYTHGFTFVCPSSLSCSYAFSTHTGSAIPFGHLVFDRYDSAYHDLVWRGRVSKAISFSGDSDKARQQLNKAVAKLIKAYPRAPRD